MPSLFHPARFQGNLKRRRYFEGWYCKHVSPGRDAVYAFIPGIALSPGDRHAFIQVINGLSGKTAYLRYPLADFNARRDRFEVRIGGSVFSRQGISLDLDGEDIRVTGALRYTSPVPYPSTLIAPGIMGWYSYIPFMECNHGVVSADHRITGSLSVDGREIDFTGGSGYMEKDWGSSFPSSWIWLQCNTFDHGDASLMISVARIPWLTGTFTGFLCFLYTGGGFYHFNTWNRTRLKTAVPEGNGCRLILTRGRYVLTVSARPESTGSLKAPVTGRMERHIKESVNASVSAVLAERNGQTVWQDIGTCAGLEIMEKIFEFV